MFRCYLFNSLSCFCPSATALQYFQPMSDVYRSSPYLGKYSSLEEGLTKNGMRPRSGKKDRPVSAQHGRSKNRPISGEFNYSRPYSAMPSHQQRQKPKIDAKFIADPDLWDPATPREEKTTLRRTRSARTRPQSATVYGYKR